MKTNPVTPAPSTEEEEKTLRDKGSAPVATSSTQKKSQATSLHLQARCLFGHVETLSQGQIEEAGSLGAAFCSKCGNVMIISKATSK